MRGRHAAPPATVLVVDDEPSIRFLCRVNLEHEGHTVVEAGSLAEARRILGDEVIDVVLLDLHLGGEHGAELIEECHAHEPPVPVVLVTASLELGTEGLEDADAILPKPFELADLATTVRDVSRVHAEQ